MKKRYTAATILSINILVDGKHKRHLRFDPLSCSGSVFVTSDEATQKAIENHSQFGKMFKLAEVTSEHPVEEEAEEPVEAEKNIVHVSSLAEAKDYLVETFDLTRTKLRTREAIVRAAADHGVEFAGI